MLPIQSCACCGAPGNRFAPDLAARLVLEGPHVYKLSSTCFMTSIKTASVFGLGKLGACIAATLAVRGFNVLGVDIDSEKVRRVNEGLSPVEEPLLAETITI